MAHAHGHGSWWLPPQLVCKSADVCFVLVFVPVPVLPCYRTGIVRSLEKPLADTAEEGSLVKVRPNEPEETEEPEESRGSWDSWHTAAQAWLKFGSMLVEEVYC